MKRILLSALAALVLSGCAFVHGTTKRTATVTTNNIPVVVETTHLTAYALFDANQTFNRLSVRSSQSNRGTNSYGPGTYIGGLNESATSSGLTNVIKLLEAIAPLAGGF